MARLPRHGLWSRMRLWLLVLRAYQRDERVFLEWDGRRWSVIE